MHGQKYRYIVLTTLKNKGYKMINVKNILRNFNHNSDTLVITDYLEKLDNRDSFKDINDFKNYVNNYLVNDINNVNNVNVFNLTDLIDIDIYPFIVEYDLYINNYFKINNYKHDLTFIQNMEVIRNQYCKDIALNTLKTLKKFLSDIIVSKTGFFDFYENNKEYRLEYSFTLNKLVYIIYDSKFNNFVIDFYCDDGSIFLIDDIKDHAIYTIQNNKKLQ